MHFTQTHTRHRQTTNASTSVKRAQQARAQRSGGPVDRALYRCGCGHAFQAAVSTSVPCPRCGQGQAW